MIPKVADFSAKIMRKNKEKKRAIGSRRSHHASARALDGEEIAAGIATARRAAIGHGPGDVAAIDPLERDCVPKRAALAEGGRRGIAAASPARKALVDAVAVAIAPNNEDAPFRLRGGERSDDDAGNGNGENGAHGRARLRRAKELPIETVLRQEG